MVKHTNSHKQTEEINNKSIKRFKEFTLMLGVLLAAHHGVGVSIDLLERLLDFLRFAEDLLLVGIKVLIVLSIYK